MHNDVTVIHQNPASLVVPFNTERGNAPLTELLIDGIRNGLHLPRRPAAANEEVIGDRRGMAHVKDDDIQGFPIRRSPCRESGFFLGAKSFHRFSSTIELM